MSDVQNADQNAEVKSTNSDAPAEIKKKGFQMPSAITILIGILIGLIVLSWILSWAGVTYTNDDSVTTEVKPMGIFGLGLAIGNGFMGGSDLIFYLFVLGAVIELTLVSGTLEAGIGSLVKGLNGKELFLIPILFVLFSAGGTIYGMSEETIALFVIVVPALSLAGFDTVTGLMVILGGTATGCAVSTVNPFATGAADAAIKDAGVDGVMSNILIFNLVWWVIITAITCTMITGYAAYVKKHPNKSFAKSGKKESDEWLAQFSSDETKTATGRQKAALAIFMTAFVLMVLFFIPWPDVLRINTDSSSYYNNETILDGPILGTLFGLMTPMGWWYFGELSMMFIFVGVIIALILYNTGEGEQKMTKDRISDAAWTGAKGMFGVVVVISIARGVPYIMENTGMQDAIVGGMINAISGASDHSWLVVYSMFLILFLLSTVITSTSGLANAALPLMTAFVTGVFPADQQVYIMGGIMISYMMAIGFWNFFVPTNPIVMASFQYSRVQYQDGVKLALPMALAVLAVTLLAMIPSYMLLMH